MVRLGIGARVFIYVGNVLVLQDELHRLSAVFIGIFADKGLCHISDKDTALAVGNVGQGLGGNIRRHVAATHRHKRIFRRFRARLQNRTDLDTVLEITVDRIVILVLHQVHLVEIVSRTVHAVIGIRVGIMAVDDNDCRLLLLIGHGTLVEEEAGRLRNSSRRGRRRYEICLARNGFIEFSTYRKKGRILKRLLQVRVALLFILVHESSVIIRRKRALRGHVDCRKRRGHEIAARHVFDHDLCKVPDKRNVVEIGLGLIRNHESTRAGIHGFSIDGHGVGANQIAVGIALGLDSGDYERLPVRSLPRLT